MKRMALILATVALTVMLAGCPGFLLPNNVATLSSLTVGSLTLTPAFSESVTSYTASVAFTTTSVAVTAVVKDDGASASVAGGAATKTVDLAVGDNAIAIVVTAEDGTTTKTYTVTVTRLALGASTLSASSITQDAVSLSWTAVTEPTAADNYRVMRDGVQLGTTTGTTYVDATVDFLKSYVYTIVAENNGLAGTSSNALTVNVAGSYSAIITVVDTLNGSYLPGATIAILDHAGEELATIAPTAYPYTLTGLFEGEIYTLESRKTGYAEGAYQDFVATATPLNVTLISQLNNMVCYPAESPDIVAVSVSSSPIADTGMVWIPVTSGMTLSLSTLTAIKVDVTSKSAVSSSSGWTGFPVKVAFDNMPDGAWQGGLTYLGTLKDNELNATTHLFETEAIFEIPSGFSLVDGAHSLNVVTYDVANNRAELRLPVVSSVTAATSVDISGYTPSSLSLRFRSYGTQNQRYVKDPETGIDAFVVTAGDATCYDQRLKFKLTDGAATPANQGILGYDVYRSADDVTYTKVATINYGSLKTLGGNGATAGYHCFFDTDSGLEPGKTYYYKVVAFNGAYRSKESAAISGLMLPPHTTMLTSPASKVISTTKNPTFTFTASDPALIAMSDYYQFALCIRDMNGGTAYYNQFIHDIYGDFGTAGHIWLDYNQDSYADSADGDIDLTAAGTDVTYSNGVYTFNGTLGFNLQPGQTYQWDVFGYQYASGTPGDTDVMYPPAVYYYPSAGSVSISYGEGYYEGCDTRNGWYVITIADNAN